MKGWLPGWAAVAPCSMAENFNPSGVAGPQDFHQKTSAGGVITIVASLVMVLLFMSELRELCMGSSAGGWGGGGAVGRNPPAAPS